MRDEEDSPSPLLIPDVVCKEGTGWIFYPCDNKNESDHLKRVLVMSIVIHFAPHDEAALSDLISSS